MLHPGRFVAKRDRRDRLEIRQAPSSSIDHPLPHYTCVKGGMCGYRPTSSQQPAHPH